MPNEHRRCECQGILHKNEKIPWHDSLRESLGMTGVAEVKMASEIKFSTDPYYLKYTQEGKAKTIRRRPPPKLHDILPNDKVELTVKHSDDFLAGKEYKVTHINVRHPNILQLENSEGQTTFASFYDLVLDAEGRAKPKSRDSGNGDDPVSSKYLLWP